MMITTGHTTAEVNLRLCSIASLHCLMALFNHLFALPHNIVIQHTIIPTQTRIATARPIHEVIPSRDPDRLLFNVASFGSILGSGGASYTQMKQA